MTSSTATGAPPAGRLEAAKRATYRSFAGSGFAFAGWASRIPQVRSHFHLRPSSLGLVLLSIAAGSIVSLPLSGPVIARFGSRATVTAMAALLGAGLATAAAGYLVGLGLLVAGLFVLGFANGAWDVAMNVQAAAVEQHLRRSIMSRFHAGWSLGTVAGAILGTAMVALRVPVTIHLAAVAALVTVVVCRGTRRFIQAPSGGPHDDPGAGAPAAPVPRRRSLAAWGERRTLAVGLFVLAFAFAEGTGNDWISVAVIDDRHFPAALGTLAFATFLAAMTAGRWFGPVLLDRHGRVRVVRALACTGIAGVALFVFGPAAPDAFGGALLWGAGASLGFPVGMSAGADEPRFAAGRVSVIASIGYCAFLGGPPLIGLLANHLSVLRAICAVAVLLGLSAAIAVVVRPPAAARPPG